MHSTNRKKDGKDHRYFSIVENQRVSAGKTVQRTVLYLGEINDQQQASWRKSLAVFDEEKQQFTVLSLFPEDRPLPEDAVDSIQVKLSGLELRRPRAFGNCWLASELWHQLGLSEFGEERMPEGREAVSWEKVLRLLVVNRLLEPGSEFRVHRHWFVESAMDALLEENFAVADKDRLYRCLDRVRELISGLQVLVQGESLQLVAGLALGPALMREMGEMRVKITGEEQGGSWREGEQDDLVFAVAVACWGMRKLHGVG